MAEMITMSNGVLVVPDDPIIPFVEGDGTGVDIWPAAQLVMDAAAAKHGKSIAWKEVLAGQKAFDATGSWLPDETVQTFRDYLIGMNMSADKTFELKVPAHAGPIRNLVTAREVAPGSVAKVGPRSTVVLYFN